MPILRHWNRDLPPRKGVRVIARWISSGRISFNLKDGVTASYQARKKAIVGQLNQANSKYEKFIGIADVQEAQRKVKEAESTFLEARARERTVLRQMVETREKLKHVREKLSHVNYSNPMYVQLATDQHELVNQEEQQKVELEEVEDHERDSFQNLSNAMRESYEQERARVERTKNWSIIGTVIGTIIGMMGSMYMNRVRTKDLMKAVKDTGSKEELDAKLDQIASDNEQKQAVVVTALNTVSENLSEMSNALQVQNMEVLAGLITDPLSGQTKPTKQLSPNRTPQPSIPMQALVDEIGHYNEALVSLTNAVKSLSNSGGLSSSTSSLDKLQLLLENQSKVTASLQIKFDEVIAASNKTSSGVLGMLQTINKKLSNLHAEYSSPESGPVIVELPDETIADNMKHNWPVGVKDALIWGFVICGLYMFIKF